MTQPFTESDLFEAFSELKQQLQSHIIGQPHLIERLLIALLADGHLLVEGPPGLAKTKAIQTLSSLIEADFQRIQFTPDLLPSDITGTDIYRPETHSFEFQPGPIFHNLILADEINRAPAKVQAALLEAMAERQVSVGGHSMALPELFLVMATQNPIEQEGTYPLPEAQLDRFMLQVMIDYPDFDSERQILELVEKEARMEITSQTPQTQSVKIQQQQIFAARKAILDLTMSDNVKTYIVACIMATRTPEKYSEALKRYLQYGVSPRATLALSRAARAHAWLQGESFVSPEDVQAVIHDVLRHRLLLSFEAEAEQISADAIVDLILTHVPVI
ncbi:AAA family ATPase [Galenea microaerophila]